MASQKHKYDLTIKGLLFFLRSKLTGMTDFLFSIELETEITALTEQLIQTHQQNTDYDELMKQTAVFQNSMHDLETQNDVLRKTVESYETRFSDITVQLEKIHFEVDSRKLFIWTFYYCLRIVFSVERKSDHRNRKPQVRYCG